MGLEAVAGLGLRRWGSPSGDDPVVLALHGLSTRRRVVVGALAGAGYYGPALAFVVDFSPPGYVVLVVLECAALAGACLLVPAGEHESRSRRRWAGWSGGWWVVPGALVLLEAAQARAPFGGFPLTALALSQVDGPLAAGAPLGGPLLVTGLVDHRRLVRALGPADAEGEATEAGATKNADDER